MPTVCSAFIERTFITRTNGAVQLVGRSEQQASSGLQTTGDGAHQLLVVGDMLDTLGADGHIECADEILPAIQLSKIQDIETNRRRLAHLRALRADLLIFSSQLRPSDS